MKESELQRRVKALVEKGQFPKAILGADRVKAALAQVHNDFLWPRYPVDYLARMRTVEAASYALERVNSLELVIESNSSLSLKTRETMYSDLLCCNLEYATLVLMELKVGKQTPRELLTEILAYEQEIINHCPSLTYHDLVFVVIGTDFSTTVNHALTGLMTWSHRKVLCLVAEPYNDTLQLHVHLPDAWSPIGQGILPPAAMATADLCLYPKDGLSKIEMEALAVTAMDLVVREADRAGAHGFVMLWEDAMYPEVSLSQFNLTVGVINPFAFLPEAIEAGILPLVGTKLQEYLLKDEKHEELATAWGWCDTVGNSALDYLTHWCNPSWEGFSTWHNQRVAIDRIDGPSYLLEQRAFPLAFDFFGVLGEHARKITAQTNLRSNFMPATVRPGVDWKHPRLGAAILENASMPELVPKGQWTFGAFYELGHRLARLATFATAFLQADASGKTKLAARLFWAEADLWEPLHALRERYRSTEELSTSPPTIIFGAPEVPRQVEEIAKWIADNFIGKRSELLKYAFALGLNSVGLNDAAIRTSSAERERQAKEHLTAARMLISISIDQLLSADAPVAGRDHLWQALIEITGISNVKTMSAGEIKDAVAKVPDAKIISTFQDILVLTDDWSPQLWHRLSPAALGAIDWEWLKNQITALGAQGVKHPGLTLWPNAELTVSDFSAYAAVPALPDKKTHVLVSIHAGGAEVILPMEWTRLEKSEFGRIEKILGDRAQHNYPTPFPSPTAPAESAISPSSQPSSKVN